MSRRRDTLSFGHHAEVAARAEPEQDYWLRQAEEHCWPVKRGCRSASPQGQLEACRAVGKASVSIEALTVLAFGHAARTE